MCFRNLPIEFDSEGKARLKEGLDDPWGIRRAAARRSSEPFEALPRAPETQRAVMRAAGSHAFGVVVNHRQGRR